MMNNESRKENKNDRIGREPSQPKPHRIDIIANSVRSLQDRRGGGRD
jgi:hypothetical protein